MQRHLAYSTVKRLTPALLAASALSCSISVNAAESFVPPLEDQLEEIIVSGAIEGRKLGETILGATILKKDEILRRLNGSIGETLRNQPGISSTFFGPGASRPIIRGLGGDRIRVLDNGIGSIDASSTSPDHAVAVEPALAERIEILRGTAMLIYGSSAAGGVINVIDGRIPTRAPENGIDGAVRYGYSSVNQGHEATGALKALLADSGSSQLVFHGDYFYRDTDDYDIPGFAESNQLRALEEADGEAPEEEAFGTVENTAVRSEGGSAGLSLIFDNGFLGLNVRKLDSLYGVPGGHGHEEEHEEEEGDHEDEEEEEFVRIDLDQTRYDLSGELSGDFGFFSKAKIRFGYSDYTHTELEGEEIGTIFSNEGWEGRLDLIEKGGDNWKGSTGLQIRSRDFSAVGAEAFVPPAKSTQVGIYTVKEYTTGDWRFDVGGRYEHTTYDVAVLNTERSFDGFSGSVGAGYDINRDTFIGATLFRTERAPSTEELFSNGPHLATNAFELGNPDLGLETATGLEATVSFNAGPFSFVANAYFTSYDDFIYEVATGEEEDDLPIFEFRANDAQLYGFEVKSEYHVGSFKTSSLGDIDVHLDGQIDVIKADLDRGGNDTIPRLPPVSALVGIEAQSATFDLRTELEVAGSKNDVADIELPTDGFAFWNAYFSLRPFENKSISFDLQATNITNSTGRPHTSFLKELAPLPGRNIRLSLRAEF